MERLRTAMGNDFPAAPPRQQLDRASKWLDVKEYAKARQEYTTLSEILAGAEKDEAKVGMGVTDYISGEAHTSLLYLKNLHGVSLRDGRGTPLLSH